MGVKCEIETRLYSRRKGAARDGSNEEEAKEKSRDAFVHRFALSLSLAWPPLFLPFQPRPPPSTSSSSLSLPLLLLLHSKNHTLQKNSRRAAAPRTTRAVVERPAVSGGAASIASRSPSSSVLAVILGGGAGTRLYPLTKQRAKPAVPIGGAYRLIDVPMSNCINSGSYLCFF